MKKSLKVTLAIIMTVVFILACSAVAVFAATYTSDSEAISKNAVCRIGKEGTGTYYTSIADAVSNAKNEDTITVIKNTSISDSITIDKKLTLTSVDVKEVTASKKSIIVHGDNADLIVAGKLKLTCTSDEFIWLSKGRLEIADQSQISATFTAICVCNKDDNNSHTSTVAELVVSGGTIKDTASNSKGVIGIWSHYAKITIDDGLIEGKNLAAIRNEAKNVTLNVNGGTVKANEKVIRYGGDGKTSSGTINVRNDALIEAASKQCVYIDNTAATALNIYGGTLNCKGTWAIEVGAGSDSKLEINMYDGTFKSANQGFTICRTNTVLNISGGTVSAGKHAVYVEGATPQINISGEAKISANEQVIFFETSNGSTGGTLNINGGEIKTKTGEGTIYIGNKSATVNLTITDGDISTVKGDAIYKGGEGTLNAKISGGTITGKTYTVDLAKGKVNLDITGGTIIATEDVAISKWGSSTLDATVNISDDAKIYAGKQKKVNLSLTAQLGSHISTIEPSQ